MSDLLQCIDLTKTYGQITALNNLNFTLGSGKIIGLLGPNGSGKTTLIKIINGLLTPTSGKVLIEGKEPGVETKKIVAYLPDRNFLGKSLTVDKLVKLFVDFYEDFRPELAYEMIDKLQIPRNSQLKTLSKGNKEKVCLILVMSRNAKLYLRDIGLYFSVFSKNSISAFLGTRTCRPTRMLRSLPLRTSS